MRKLNPDTITMPASNYSQAVIVPKDAERLIVSGQIGVNPDGQVADGMAAQMERCWLNIFGILEAAGMDKRDLVKATVFVTDPTATTLYREIRYRMLDGHAPAATYVIVSGLASPEFLVEIEAEAVKE